MSIAKIRNAPQVGAIAPKLGADVARWLPYRTPTTIGQPRMRLFGFPYAGGAASTLHRWMSPLADVAEICAVQLPGREGRRAERAFRAIEPLVDALEFALAPLIAQTPSVFFGHSMGALIAYELAARLHKAGQAEPVHLILSGMASPHGREFAPPLHEYPKNRAIETLASMGGTPKIILDEPDLIDLVLPVIQADIALVYSRSRNGGPVLQVPITTLAGDNDPLAPSEEVQQWRDYGGAGFAERVFAGGHFFINEQVQGVMDVMRSILTRIEREG